MAGLDRLVPALVEIPFRIEEFPHHVLFPVEEDALEKHAQRIRPREKVVAAGGAMKRKERLEEMHVRVLAPGQLPGVALEPAAMRREEFPVHKCDRVLGERERAGVLRGLPA